MRYKIPEHSIFAILLRKPWWVSGAVSLGFVVVSITLLPMVMKLAGLCVAVPFAVIAAMSAWRARGKPRPQAVQATATVLAEMTWASFSQQLQDAFRRDGSVVERLPGARADFMLKREGKHAVVAARRWKAQRVGIPPLRELLAEQRELGAAESIFVALGEVTDTARQFAQANNVKIMTAEDLARLMPGLHR